MFLLGMRGSALDGLGLPDRPQVLGGGVPAARALLAFLPLVAIREPTSSIDRHAVQRLTSCLEPQAGPAAAVRPSWITEAYDHIREDGTHRTTLERLSLRFRTHPVALARTFRKHYGTSVGALRRRVRADRAIERLLRGNDTLTDLALELGYADQSHFTREFKRETGWSPGRFRTATAAWGRPPRA
jgi:AraC family transcriptional regulator